MRAFALIVIWSASGCSFSGGPTGPIDPVYNELVGTVVDFESAQPVAIEAIDVLGVVGATASFVGSEFTISNVLSYSVVHIRVTATGSLPTVNPVIEVIESDIADLTLRVVSPTYRDKLAVDAGLIPEDVPSLVLVQLLDGQGAPLAGVGKVSIATDESTAVPTVLETDLSADPALAETTDSGWLSFFDVSEGLLQLAAVTGSGIAIVAAVSPVSDGGSTIIEAHVTPGEPEGLPTGVSFDRDIVPIFSRRGCTQCHRKKAEGQDLGGLSFDKEKEIFEELTIELSPNSATLRTDLALPASSLILTKPSLEDPPDGHPNSTFASPSDSDYQLLLGWITEGALEN